MRSDDFSELGVLIVDDNRHFISILRTYLREFGVRQVHEAVDAQAALDVLAEADIDMALIDLRLGGVDGLDLTRTIRTEPDSRNATLPIIMVTAHAEQSLVQEAINAGVNEFLLKPISARILYDRLLYVLDKPRPFLRVAGYFGPERRRAPDSSYTGPERRVNDSPVPTFYESVSI